MAKHQLFRRVECLEAAANQIQRQTASNPESVKWLRRGLDVLGYSPQGNESPANAACRAIGITGQELRRLLEKRAAVRTGWEHELKIWPEEDVLSLASFCLIRRVGRYYMGQQDPPAGTDIETIIQQVTFEATFSEASSPHSGLKQENA